jgi:preprotein translocase subunit SecG
MLPIILIIHVLGCIGLILIVLLQKGKGASMGAAFGGSSQTVFGSTGAAPFLSKLTTFIAIVFMLTSLGLSFFFGRGASTSIMEGVGKGQTPPAAETTTAPPPPAENSQDQ